MSGRITGTTQLFAILGNPVAHTLSPVLQNAAFRAAGVDAVYAALASSEEHVEPVMRSLAGGNVTIPYKGVAAQALDRATARVQRTLACNTFWTEGRRLLGDNTDVAGFTIALQTLLPDSAGTRVLLLGAGGAARAALYGLLEAGADEVVVIARTRARQNELQHVSGRRARRLRIVRAQNDIRNQGFDVVVNATPLGLRPGDSLPLRFEKLAALRAAFDMVYRPGGTAWVARARALGIPAIDGTEMLVQQAAAAFELWWDRDAPLARMRAAMAAPHR